MSLNRKFEKGNLTVWGKPCCISRAILGSHVEGVSQSSYVILLLVLSTSEAVCLSKKV